MRRVLPLLTSVVACIVTLSAAVDPCKGRRNKTFSSRVLVELGMDHRQKVTTWELNNLRSAFVEAYNELAVVNSNNPDHCDIRYTRAVKSVTLEQKDYFYLYENGKHYRRMFLFYVTAGCNNCPFNFYLFDKSNSRRLGAPEGEEEEFLDEPPVDEADADRELFTVGGICQCKPSAERRAPTEDEFRIAFKDKVERYKKSRKLNLVKSVTNIVQLDKVSCVNEETDFESVIITKLKNNPTPEDIAAMELGFLDSYNELTKTRYCDPLHRRVTEVEVEEYTSSNRRLGAPRKRFRMKLKGRCRGCKRAARLFDDVSQNEGSGTGSGTCWCARFPAAKRKPKSGEFNPVYDRTVKATNNVGVEGVDEL